MVTLLFFSAWTPPCTMNTSWVTTENGVPMQWCPHCYTLFCMDCTIITSCVTTENGVPNDVHIAVRVVTESSVPTDVHITTAWCKDSTSRVIAESGTPTDMNIDTVPCTDSSIITSWVTTESSVPTDVNIAFVWYTLTPPPQLAELLLKVVFPLMLIHIATAWCKDSTCRVVTERGTPTDAHIATVLHKDS